MSNEYPLPPHLVLPTLTETDRQLREQLDCMTKLYEQAMSNHQLPPPVMGKDVPNAYAAEMMAMQQASLRNQASSHMYAGVQNEVSKVLERNRTTVPLELDRAEMYLGMFPVAERSLMESILKVANGPMHGLFSNSVLLECEFNAPMFGSLHGALFWFSMPTGKKVPVKQDGDRFVVDERHSMASEVGDWLTQVVAVEEDIRRCRDLVQRYVTICVRRNLPLEVLITVLPPLQALHKNLLMPPAQAMKLWHKGATAPMPLLNEVKLLEDLLVKGLMLNEDDGPTAWLNI